MTIPDDRADTRRWAGAFLAVLGAHAVPALVAAYWLGPLINHPPAEPAIMIDMAPLTAPPVPPAEQPPGPKQIRADAPRPRVEETPVKTPPLPAPAVAMPARPPEPPRETKPPAPQTSAPPARPVAPAPVPSSASPTWQGLVLGRLNTFKRYPALAQSRRQQGVPYIRIVMNREGKILSSSLARSSGFAALDQEAVSLPRRAQPLPKPPAEVAGATIELVVPVEFFVR